MRENIWRESMLVISGVRKELKWTRDVNFLVLVFVVFNRVVLRWRVWSFYSGLFFWGFFFDVFWRDMRLIWANYRFEGLAIRDCKNGWVCRFIEDLLFYNIFIFFFSFFVLVCFLIWVVWVVVLFVVLVVRWCRYCYIDICFSVYCGKFLLNVRFFIVFGFRFVVLLV